MCVMTTYHQALELKALTIKIEKLDRWLWLYRCGKLRPESCRKVIDVMSMLAAAERERITLLNNK